MEATTLRERALAANTQRDEILEKKTILRLKEEVQKILGISVDPTENSVTIDGYRFFMKYQALGRESVLMCETPKTTYEWEIRSLADLGEAIVADEAPEEPEG